MVLQELKKCKEIDLSYVDLSNYEDTTEIQLDNYTVGYHLYIETDYKYYSETRIQPEESTVVKQEINISDIVIYDWRTHRVAITDQEYDQIEIIIKEKIIL